MIASIADDYPSVTRVVNTARPYAHDRVGALRSRDSTCDRCVVRQRGWWMFHVLVGHAPQRRRCVDAFRGIPPRSGSHRGKARGESVRGWSRCFAWLRACVGNSGKEVKHGKQEHDRKSKTATIVHETPPAIYSNRAQRVNVDYATSDPVMTRRSRSAKRAPWAICSQFCAMS